LTGGPIGDAGVPMTDLGRFLVVVGVVLLAVGLLLSLGPRLPGGSWLGRLPGDIHIERPGFSLYIPLATCVVISVLLTLVLTFFRR
jgi:hypothetical protein